MGPNSQKPWNVALSSPSTLGKELRHGEVLQRAQGHTAGTDIQIKLINKATCVLVPRHPPSTQQTFSVRFKIRALEEPLPILHQTPGANPC